MVVRPYIPPVLLVPCEEEPPVGAWVTDADFLHWVQTGRRAGQDCRSKNRGLLELLRQ